MRKKALFRFYAELNDFLPEEKKGKEFIYEFTGKPSVKDAIEALGIPHTEADLILINNQSVSFSSHIYDGDIVSVYPVFESIDIKKITKLRKRPLRETKFILDVNLGKLAAYLRMLGFDTIYDNRYTDQFIIQLAKQGKRIILTKDIGLLKNRKVTHGYWVRSQEPKKQVKEIIDRFNLESNINTFTRCIKCNGIIKQIKKDFIINQIPDNTKKFYHNFYQCTECKKIYWQGSHYDKMKSFISQLSES
jgi:uncharacterized protein with PIN domain